MSKVVGTDKNFQTEVLDYQGLVLVDFGAAWCGPCQMLTPIIDEISDDKNNSVKVVTVDADTEIDVCTKYNVTALPTVIVFNKGVQINSLTGFHQKSDFLALLKV